MLNAYDSAQFASYVPPIRRVQQIAGMKRRKRSAGSKCFNTVVFIVTAKRIDFESVFHFYFSFFGDYIFPSPVSEVANAVPP